MPTVKSILLFFVCGIAVLFSQRAEAALHCRFSSSPTINFEDIDPFSTDAPIAKVNMTVTCRKDWHHWGRRQVHVCLRIGDGTGKANSGVPFPNTMYPRLLKRSGSNDHAGFQIYKKSERNTSFWGTSPANPSPNRVSFTLSNGRGSKEFTFYAKMRPYQSTLGNFSNLVPGDYASAFTGSHIASIRTLTYSNQNPGNYCDRAGVATAIGRGYGDFPFYVQAKVKKQCRITPATRTSAQNIGALDFGEATDLSSTGTEKTGQIAFNVQCTKQTPYRIGLDNGRNFDTATNSRRMKHTNPAYGNEYVRYALYKDLGRQTPWGNDLANGTNTQNGTGTGAKILYTAYGKVPIGQNPIATATNEQYEDTVTITVQY